MNRSEFIRSLQRYSPEPGSKPFSANLVFGRHDNVAIVAVGDELEFETRVHAIVDAVCWWKRLGPDSARRHILAHGSGGRCDEVLETVATIRSGSPGLPEMAIWRDYDPVLPVAPDFSGRAHKWLKDLRNRDEARPPAFAESLRSLINDPSFRWYRTVTGTRWSGRLEGLEVCTIEDATPANVRIDIGMGVQNRDDSPERAISKKLLGSLPREFSAATAAEAALAIRTLSAHRHQMKNRDEHHLESRVLRGDVQVVVNGGCLETVCVDYPFQFPAQWSRGGRARYVDILMHIGPTPYVVELKDGVASIGQYYRHAITQAVLYREFVKKATGLRRWFEKHNLDQATCRAVVAFPLDTRSSTTSLQELSALAELFEVEVVPLQLGGGRYRATLI